ncbi:MAG: glycosyltransferase family 1 protein, partial [Cyanobacteria bacterium P01_F01_bin.42]
YEGREHMDAIAPDASVLEKPELKNRPYVLAVSSLSPHKNFGAVVRALDHLRDLPDLAVVIIGGGNQQVFAETNLADNSQVIRPGYVTDAQLKALYQNALGFIHASLYEGFGLTPLEAMTCGCPVIVSRAAAIPEVCGEAALYFDPQDPQDIARQVRQMVTDSSLRESLRHKAIAQAQKFSWRTCALETFDVLKSIGAE